jgi:hypothetical protein
MLTSRGTFHKQVDYPATEIFAGILTQPLLHLEAVRMTSCLWYLLRRVQAARSYCLLLASQR